MKQVVEFSQHLKEQINKLENACENISKQLESEYKVQFQGLGAQLLIECIRTIKGKSAKPSQVFEDYYESYIEIGIEKEEEYFPNAYIPIWRCKKELFQETGYLTRYNIEELEGKIKLILEEMLYEKLEEINLDPKI